MTSASTVPQQTGLTSVTDLAYLAALKRARKFTIEQGLEPGSHLPAWNDEIQLQQIAAQIAGLLHEVISAMREQGLALRQFGVECGNIHSQLLPYLHKTFPNVPINLAIGQTDYDNQVAFAFSESTFIQWRNGAKPKILHCHVWLSIGEEYILDVTIGTWVNTRMSSIEHYGGVHYGRPGALKYLPIAGHFNTDPEITNKLKYQPVAIGLPALVAVAPESNHKKPKQGQGKKQKPKRKPKPKQRRNK